MQPPHPLTEFLQYPASAVTTLVRFLRDSIFVTAVWPIDVDNFLSELCII